MNTKKKVEMVKIDLELYPRLYEIIKQMSGLYGYSMNEAINQLLISHDQVHHWWVNEVSAEIEERDKSL